MFGNTPQVDVESRIKGTYQGRAINAADMVDAQMSGQYAGEGNMMEAASTSREELSPDRMTRKLYGVQIEGVGPQVMDITQRVVEKTPQHSRIEFQVNASSTESSIRTFLSMIKERSLHEKCGTRTTTLALPQNSPCLLPCWPKSILEALEDSLSILPKKFRMGILEECQQTSMLDLHNKL